MNLTDLLKAQEDYFNEKNNIREFIAGAKWVIERLSEMSAPGINTAISELYDEFQKEEKWITTNPIDNQHRCVDCDRFICCETIKSQKICFCQMYNSRIIFKRKEQWEHQEETD